MRQQWRMEEDDEKYGVTKDAKYGDNHINATINNFIDYFIIAKWWMIIHKHICCTAKWISCNCILSKDCVGLIYECY